MHDDGLPAKISAPAGVDHRVHATVDPPEPGHHGRQQLVLEHAALVAESGEQVDDEKR